MGNEKCDKRFSFNDLHKFIKNECSINLVVEEDTMHTRTRFSVSSIEYDGDEDQIVIKYKTGRD